MSDCEEAFETWWNSVKQRLSPGSTAMDDQALAHLRQVNWQAFKAGWDACEVSSVIGGRQ